VLVKNGIPFDLALAMPDVQKSAFCIVFGQLEGSDFNFETMKFQERT
jgi:hypothetical protein